MGNKEMLLIPGPTPVVDEIYDALASETRGHTDSRFVAIYKNALAQTKELFQTDGEVFVLAGSGTLAMEMAIVNTVGKGEKILVISHGYFGDRFTPLAKAYGIQVEVLQAEWGKQVELATVKAKIAEGNFKAVTITHADTSTGVVSDLDALVPIIKQAGTLIILDGVVATAAIKNWMPVMNDPGKYFATPPVNLIYAYDVAMKIVLDEGIAKREERHIAYGRAVRFALSTYGMVALADETVAAPTLSCMLYPEGLEDAKFRAKLAEKGIIVAGSLAHLAGKAFRIGHMGNTTPTMLEQAVKLIGESLNELGHAVSVEEAVARLKEELAVVTM